MQTTAGLLLAQNLSAADAVAGRLRASQRDLAPLFPLDPERIAGLTHGEMRDIDGMLKQVENLQDILAGRVFRGVLLVGSEDPRGLTARDIANRLETLGAIANAEERRALADLRNRLAHEYPLDRVRQSTRINDAYAAIPVLLEELRRIESFVAAHYPEVVALRQTEQDTP